jgi:hypothetical protein
MHHLRQIVFAALVAALAGTASADVQVRINQLASLPVAVSNNAVTSVKAGGREYLVTFNGLASGKTHSDTHAMTFVLDSPTGKWAKAPDVPGGKGRLAAAAATAGDLAYVFGGYAVAADGSEVSTPWVHAFDPVNKTFSDRATMPVPVDDAIATTYMDRFIYLVSGWHDLANVNLVQRYDTETDTWDQATPIPGSPVFGHAGGIVDNQIVYCDGVRIRVHANRPRDYIANDKCYLGIIDADAPRTIDWRTIDAHPGNTRYRAAAAGVDSLRGVLFVGGTSNPYNYSGIGYDGRPSEPQANAVLFDVRTLAWKRVVLDGQPTMDHRALAYFDNRWITVGGMTSGQAVTDRVTAYELTLKN